MNNIRKVHVVFKTHLDIGFTDLASHVVDQYFHSFIPQALDLADEFNREQGKERFVWTTGSWLIHEFLKTADPEQKKRMEDGIAAGSIVWHGLPFTTHTELMDPALFEHGLSIARRLDEKYGKRTIAAKMTDVPGHTIGMVPYMAKYGIQYLHLGVNYASTKPNVPDVFVWRAQDGSEIVVNYAGSYGNITLIDGLDEVLVFAHTNDNMGPPKAADIRKQFAQLAEQFPGAMIEASTMDAFAEKLVAMKDQFPVITEEIGDSWIHGAASDPLKIAHYRELLKLRSKWVEEGRLDASSRQYADFCDQLMLIPEHTWGMDEKTHLTDFKHYSVPDFHAARQADVVAKDAIHPRYGYFGIYGGDHSEKFEAASGKSFSLLESSWHEQRNYINQAISMLSSDLQNEAHQALTMLSPDGSDRANGREFTLGQQLLLGCFSVDFGIDGSINRLVDERGKVWADDQHRLGVFEYETFGMDHYQNWYRDYVVNWAETYFWSEPDFGKPGMEFAEPRPEHKRFVPRISHAVVREDEQYDEVSLQLTMSQEASQTHGAPKKLRILYRFFKQEKTIEVELSWFDKQAYRLPEASWFSFALKVDNPNLWRMDKLGERVSPLEVVKNGNRSLHAVHSGVHYHGSDGRVHVETLDAPVLSPGEKRMLQFDQTFAPLDGGMHFNLHNNVWGTNFRMWYEENTKFRFAIKLHSNGNGAAVSEAVR
ncbi:DUF5054 domain-containing protein [Paenibacillus lignilyticus]|uniref:DUF5054 domain-containing protein n=1 Tax=Paenibacillus lignilyticus TaxID=1172615 RepID=A0ABS5CIU9_9BACL|nr:DUF5054 domain-containing protein [Paenibacillus lignilyticus]MBP3965741.1 DUF5054 domain-containing protein [Paenibacillus lignilyticus]